MLPLLVVALLLPAVALAQRLPTPQPPPAQRPTLDALVARALADNLGRRQSALGVAAARAAAGEAAGRWLPSATINARYTERGGGVINLGELINPAYAALNGLLGQNAFPTNLDVRLPLRQETAIRLEQPIIAPGITAGVRAARATTAMRDAAHDGQGRTLAFQVRAGYLQWRRARRGTEILAATLDVLDEQLRVTERLVRAGLATPDATARVTAERAAIAQQRDDAERLAQAAADQLNVLLQRPLGTDLPLIDDADLGLGTLPPLASLAPASRRRDELRQLDAARVAVDAQVQAARAAFVPTLALAVDHGWQGNTYDFRTDRDFTLASLVFTWNVFNGGQDARRIEQARLESQRLAAQREAAERDIALDVRVAHAAAVVAHGAITTATLRRASAQRAWDAVRHRHEAGSATLLEALDARAALTAAELNLANTTTEFFLRCADLERAAALYPRALP